jgi:hypothetical protein
MTTSTAQYDHIGSKYDEYARTATLKRAECYTFFRWSQATHERAIQKAGFRAFTWYPSEVAPGDIADYGEAYWRDFYDNCAVIGRVCQK